jgi:para-nitrobenzyl esterase
MPAPDLSLRFVPVVDGTTLPADPFSPASPLSATVPILTGSNECEGIPYGNPDDPYWTSEPADDAALRSRLRATMATSDEDAARMIALYRSHRPAATAADLAAIMAGDASELRRAAYTIAAAKHAQGRAPVYLYRFKLAVAGARRQAAQHARDGAAVRLRPSRSIGFLTGTGGDRHALAANMSAAWVAFARTGNPNHAGIPQWDAWTPSRWTTMVFDTPITAVDDPWGDERRAMARA